MALLGRTVCIPGTVHRKKETFQPFLVVDRGVTTGSLLFVTPLALPVRYGRSSYTLFSLLSALDLGSQEKKLLARQEPSLMRLVAAMVTAALGGTA